MTGLPSLAVRFGRFNLVGGMGAVWQIFFLTLLARRFPPVIAAPIAVEIVILHNFLWHEHFTWRGRGIRSPRQIALRMWRFQAGNGLVSLMGNTIVMYALVERLKAPVTASAMAAIALCSVLNFLIADRWVYGKELNHENLIRPRRDLCLDQPHRAENAGPQPED